MGTDHEKLVFGYVHQLDFHEEFDILDEIIQIIYEYKRPCLFEYWKYPTISYKMTEETAKNCECGEYVELSARSGDNVDGLKSAIMRIQIGKDKLEESSTESNCQCIIL